MNPTFLGTIKESKVILDNPEGAKEWLQSIEGKRIKYDVSEWKKTRSNKQNKYYWKVVIQLLCDYTGYTPEEMHEAIKLKFLKKERVVNNLELPTLGSTTKLSTVEFEELMAEIRVWASGFGVVIVEPNQINY